MCNSFPATPNPHKTMNSDKINESSDSAIASAERPASPQDEHADHEAETPAILPTGGGSWAQGRISKDNQHSPKFGICFGRDMDARGIPPLSRGDIVTIEILKQSTMHALSGRASRRRTAYFWKHELAELELDLHHSILYSIHSITCGNCCLSAFLKTNQPWTWTASRERAPLAAAPLSQA